MTNVQTTAEVAHDVPPPAGIVADALAALAPFGVTTAREAGQLLPMWRRYSEMSVGDRTAVFRCYLASGTSSVASPAELVSAAAAGQPALTRIARANMLRAIYRECFAVDRDALPAPRAVRFDPRGSALQLDFDTPAQAQAWAERLGGLRSARNWAMVGATGYHAIVVWRGVLVDLVALVPAAVEHRHAGGSGGAPGECSAECACGVTFDGFDTIAEASALLDDHIARAAAAEQTSAVPA